MEITKKDNELIADLFLKPILNIMDLILVLDMPGDGESFLEKAELSLKAMKENLSSAQAISGTILNMHDVDKRAYLVKTYEAAIKLLRARHEQREKTIEFEGAKQLDKINQESINKLFGLIIKKEIGA